MIGTLVCILVVVGMFGIHTWQVLGPTKDPVRKEFIRESHRLRSLIKKNNSRYYVWRAKSVQIAESRQRVMDLGRQMKLRKRP